MSQRRKKDGLRPVAFTLKNLFPRVQITLTAGHFLNYALKPVNVICHAVFRYSNLFSCDLVYLVSFNIKLQVMFSYSLQCWVPFYYCFTFIRLLSSNVIGNWLETRPPGLQSSGSKSIPGDIPLQNKYS